MASEVLLRRPEGHRDAGALFYELCNRMHKHRFVLTPDEQFGDITPESFGCNVDDEAARVNCGFLRITFNDIACSSDQGKYSDGWSVYVLRSKYGVRILRILSIVLEVKPEDIQQHVTYDGYASIHAVFRYGK